MKYFIDTEFLEGSQKWTSWFGFPRIETKPTIDLISIGIVAEDGREYYAISKDFNLKEAWNRYDIKVDWNQKEKIEGKDRNTIKQYWIRENVLKPIHDDFAIKYQIEDKEKRGKFDSLYFNYKSLKKIINRYGKTNKQIAEEIIGFVTPTNEPRFCKDYRGNWDITYQATKRGGSLPQFYGYYSDYDWVVFCWLFGKMNDLPKGFPMYCIDLKQELDRKAVLYYTDRTLEQNISYIKNRNDYPKQTNEHNALADARWNKQLYKFLNTI